MTSVVHRRGYNISSVQKKRARFTEPQKDKKEKKFVTTNVVFKTKPKPTKASSLGKKSGKIKSTLTSRRHYSRPPSPPPKKRLTLAAESNSALNDYRSKVSLDADQTLARAYKELVQRLEQSTLAPNALSSKITHAADAAQDMCTPLAPELITATYKDDDGNVTHEERIPIGTTVAEFGQLLENQKRHLDELWHEWDEVRQEIANVGALILREPKFAHQFGLEAIGNSTIPLTQVNPEVENVRRQIQRETDDAYKELDQEAKDGVEAQKSYQDLWIQWLRESMA